jgi:tripartite-type tricarboxylate transporter receptor subunit TctC
VKPSTPIHALWLVALLALALPLHGEERFPSAPVKIIVPAAPGGGFDVFARLLGKRLAERWGEQVLVDNRAGGAGNIGATALMHAKPDGHTLLVWNDTLLINPALMASAPYDAQRDFTPISLLLYVPNILVAHPASGLKDLKAVIARAKSAPGSLSYGSPGPGSPAHLGTELLNQLAHIELRHIPYKGAGPALTDAVAGHIPLAMIAVPGAMQHLRTGRLVPIAVTSATRIEALTQVPTIKESGLPDYRVDTFFAMLGPAGMAQPLVERLEKDIHAALLEPSLYRQLVEQGFQPVGGSAAELAELIRRDLPVWRELVRKAGVKSE